MFLGLKLLRIVSTVLGLNSCESMRLSVILSGFVVSSFFLQIIWKCKCCTVCPASCH